MQDLARLVGVHPSTVSRALAGDPRIRPELVARIEATAEEVGYVRDAALSALAESRWREGRRRAAVNFGYLAGWKSEEAIREGGFFPACARLAEARGFPLVPLPFDALHMRGLELRLEAMNIRGVLVGGLGECDWEELPWGRAVWVEIEENPFNPGIHAVQTNAFRSALRAIETLVDRGFRRIVFARGKWGGQRVIRRQEAAFLLAKREHPRVRFHEWIVEPGKGQEVEGVRRFRPDVLLTAYSALGRAVRHRLDGLPWASLGLSGGDQKMAGMLWRPELRAEAAIDLLEQQYRRGAYGRPKHRQVVMLDSEWVEGRSLDR